MGESTIDPEEFLAQLKEEHRVLQWEPLAPQVVRPLGTQDQVRSTHLLEYLHGHWVLPDSYDSAAVGGGLKGRILGVFGRLTFRVLAPYFRAERDMLSHVVQVNAALERRCDELTMRCQQLNQDQIDRQVAEARNQAKLALWLHLDPTTGNNSLAGEGAKSDRT